jgi:MFS family permease
VKTPDISASDLAPATAKAEFRRSWRIVVAAMVGVAFGVNGGFCYASFAVLQNPLAQAFGRPISAIALWVFYFQMGNIAVAPLVGLLADRIGARRVVLATIPLAMLVWTLMGMIGPHLWTLYALAVCAGAVGTGAGPITYSRVVNTWFSAGKGTALGMMSAGIGLSYVGPRIVQHVVDAHGWRTGIFFIAAVLVVPLPVMLGWLREKRETVVRGKRPVETGRSVKEVLGMPVFWIAVVAFVLYGVCTAGVQFNLVPFFTASGMSRATAANYLVLLGLCSIAGRVSTGLVIDRVNVGLVCAVILLIEAVAIGTFALIGARVAPIAIPITGFAFGGEVCCMTYSIARYFGVRNLGTITGILTVIVGAGNGLGPTFLSHLRESSGSYRLPFLTGSGLAAGSAVFFLILAVFPYFKEPEASGQLEVPPVAS